MGELSDSWKDIKRKGVNMETSRRILIASDIKFIEEEYYRLVVKNKAGEKIDFYPSTSKYLNRKHGSKPGRGVYNLIDYLNRG